jgi:hypothetical protein
VTWQEVSLGILAIGCVVVLAALAGLAASVAYQALSSRGERARFNDLIEPLADELDALRDTFTRMRSRNAKRARDEKEEQPALPDSSTVPSTRSEREAILARIRASRRPQ